MAENPLLPNKKLQEMYALMQRARRLSKAPATAPRFEAILGASLLHIEPGDFVSPPLEAAILAALAAERTASKKTSAALSVTPLPVLDRLAVTTGIAHGMKLSGSDRMAVYFTDAGPATARTEPHWEAMLTHAATKELPLLFVCAEIAGASARAKAPALTWTSMAKLAKKLRLPVLPVDGADAVAVYRVMQESTARARMGGGMAVIWCALPSAAERTPARDPLSGLRRYMQTRKIALNR